MSKFFSPISQRTADAETAVYPKELNGLPRAIRTGYPKYVRRSWTLRYKPSAYLVRVKRAHSAPSRVAPQELFPVPAKLFALGQVFILSR